jgi:hypothetical protein
LSVILIALKNGVKNIQTAGYNGARTVFELGQSNTAGHVKLWCCLIVVLYLLIVVHFLLDANNTE